MDKYKALLACEAIASEMETQSIGADGRALNGPSFEGWEVAECIGAQAAAIAAIANIVRELLDVQ
jgi:hypothetical protein